MEAQTPPAAYPIRIRDLPQVDALGTDYRTMGHISSVTLNCQSFSFAPEPLPRMH